MGDYERFMNRALQLATRGVGFVSPNPLVGCVIVYENSVIGEGYHQKHGEAHAEVNAIQSVSNQKLLEQSTLFVTLEPCTHYGKTDPCVDLIIEKRIKKVVIACKDPFDQVDGKGIAKLKEAGIEVEVNVCENKARVLNKRFFIFHQKRRPYVVLKWAQSQDGFIARENFDSKWVSNPYSRQLVHKWRVEEHSILIGKNTAIHDNPLLTARDWKGKNPVRILLDSFLEVSLDSNIYNRDAQTLVINQLKNERHNHIHWIKMRRLAPKHILKFLYERHIQSVLVEGGLHILNSFIKENCWDEARVFISPSTFLKGVSAPRITGTLLMKTSVFEDELIIYQNANDQNSYVTCSRSKR